VRRILTFFCLAALLVASVAASVHQHSHSQDATCLICHVTQRAKVVAIRRDAGKPRVSASQDVNSHRSPRRNSRSPG
jgi:hypothetical protein